VIVAVPATPPVTWTTCVGTVCPAGTTTLVGDILAEPPLFVVRVINTAVGNVLASLMESGATSPGATVSVAGIMMSTTGETVTSAVASVRFGALARTMALPTLTPVTEIVAVVAVAAMVTVGEPTVTTVGSLELTLNVIPPVGAGPDKVKVRLLVSEVPRVTGTGERAMVAVTWMVLTPDV